ncbi:hypothetical protein [Brucella pituitosa]|nr:hypothetical protein [Brucella pituitosa]
MADESERRQIDGALPIRFDGDDYSEVRIYQRILGKLGHEFEEVHET